MKWLGKNYDAERIKLEIIERDKNDKNRKYNPLKKAKDATLLDTSSMNIEQVVNKILEIIHP